ncbi:hypothetical protein KX816_10890 [Sphingosinicellaceae bacterium]|nr:hypothetical protein KX816_10890 [Sphingosinicellaceae bacterium]
MIGSGGGYRRPAFALAAVALLGAAPADPLLARLIAGANALPPATLSFERSIASSQTSDGKVERHDQVDRWDGRAWTVLSIDGKPPEARAAADAVKASEASGVPGYYRLATFLAAGPVRVAEGPGSVTYRLAKLPPGGVSVKGASPEKFSAELSVDTSGPVPFVRHARYFAPAPMRIMMVAKLDRFEATADYKLGTAGRPELTRQAVDIAGALFGRSGTQHSDIALTYR